jgi:CheY-like chemotaxis protein
MSKSRILVIDDNPTATRMTRLTIERTGSYEVRELNDPAQAINTAREFKPDLILLDVCMPDIEGSKVAETLNDDHEFGDTPIVFLTCIITPSEAGKNGRLTIGRHEYMAKPARPDKLLDCIQENLPQARRRSLSAQTRART